VLSDRPELEEPDKVENLQESLVEGLKFYARKRRPDTPQVFPKLIMKLSDLRSISLRGKRLLILKRGCTFFENTVRQGIAKQSWPFSHIVLIILISAACIRLVLAFFIAQMPHHTSYTRFVQCCCIILKFETIGLWPDALLCNNQAWCWFKIKLIRLETAWNAFIEVRPSRSA